MGLHNQVALITGSAQGIGRGIVMELAKVGANIVVADINKARAESVAVEVHALGSDALPLFMDVTDSESIDNCVEKALAHFSRIDILVNNAGVGFEEKGLIEEFDVNYAVNLKGVWQVTSALIPHFKKNQKGKIINIASICGRKGVQPSTMAYNASKAAVINLTQSLAMSLGSDNINVNAICPGAVKTPQNEAARKKSNDPNWENYAQTYTQLKRPLTPEDMGMAVAFFASSQAKNITGQALNVDGGHFMN